MNLSRILRHLLTGQWVQRRTFPAVSLAAIEQAIVQSEMKHGGEICFVVEAALNTLPLLRNQTTRERALDVFSQLRVWDTEHNNGVLIYLLLADRTVEIIADRGIHAKVPEAEWQVICRTMESAFQQLRFEAGVIAGIDAVGGYLQKYFPVDPGKDTNELPNKPVML